MTLQQTGKIMNLLSAAYPWFYAGKNAPDPAQTLKLWTDQFSEDPVDLVESAVRALIDTNGKSSPPTIGAVKAKMRQIDPSYQAQCSATGMGSYRDPVIEKLRVRWQELCGQRRAAGLPATWEEAKKAGLTTAAWMEKLEERGLAL